jgi:ABC-2 type transport system ATP-binding protein
MRGRNSTRRLTVLRLEKVGRRYGPRAPWVLSDVDLAAGPGELLRIQGDNGSGKTTLLRVLAGIDQPSTGRVIGRPRTAYVPERFSVALPFAAHGYLVHLGRVHGLDGPETLRRVSAWLDRFGIAEYAATPLIELSKGTSQKVAVAQALLAEPDLLVLDEAWTGLDQAARAVLDDAVRDRVTAGGTVVFVDHDLRRLSGEPTAVHCVDNARLTRVDAAGQEDEPHVVIEAAGTGELPDSVPPGESVDPGVLRLTVVASASDDALGALLTAGWHIRSVRTEDP